MKRPQDYSHIRYFLGYGFLFLGLLAGFIPILQGWLFVAIGLILLKDERWARKMRVLIQRRYPNSRPFFRKAYGKIDGFFSKWWKV